MANNFEYHALGTYKNEICKLLLQHELSELLIDILMPTLHDERFDKSDNFRGGDYTYKINNQEEKVKLIPHIYDVPFIYTTVTDTRNVICVDTNISKNSQSTKEMFIAIYVMCHKDLLQIDSETEKKYKNIGYIGKNRMDIAVAIIGDILNGSNKFGIGQLSPTLSNPTQSYFPNSTFWGKILQYTCSDFMQDYKK